MSAGEADRRTDEELLLLAAYLLSSGRGLVDEPRDYGPLRCLDAARRVLALRSELGHRDLPGMDEVRTRMEDVMCGAMGHHTLDVLLDDLLDRFSAVLEEPDAVSS